MSDNRSKRIDLDAIERRANASKRKAFGQRIMLGADEAIALVNRIRRLETELARASGVARAGGRHDYADDFMRVAQDREDFDEVRAAGR